jgi:hypothetical protein
MHHRVSIQSGYVRPGLTIQVAKLGIGAPKKRKKLGGEGGGN